MANMTKAQLLERIHQERTVWETLLRTIGEERMTMPGVTEQWNGKDMIVHLTTWRRRTVAGLENVRCGEQPEPHPSPRDVQLINDWTYYTNRDRPVSAVLADAHAVWQQFTEIIEAFPEADLVEPGRFWWLKNKALGPYMLADFVGDFHEEHEAPLRAWLARIDQSAKVQGERASHASI